MDHIQAIRIYELEQVVHLFPPGGRLLEIGAGTGWQARALANRGFSVEALDIAGSSSAEDRVWNVKLYDGFHIPFPDGYFDAIFSSNTLEHIPHVQPFQEEIRRVLSPGGLAVHVLPTASWRFWTSITHYFFVARAALQVLGVLSDRRDVAILKAARQKNSIWQLLLKTVFPARHGERGNSLSELWYFSRFWWLDMFRDSGWKVQTFMPLRLFYTGYIVTGSALTIPFRIKASRLLGSSTIAYVVTQK
jgi:SAM-dependent methyltransferase